MKLRCVRSWFALSLLALPCAADPGQEPPPKVPDRATLEAEFAEKMSGAVLAGHFTDDTHPDRAPQEDRYTLGKVEKLDGNRWRFQAVIEYGGRSFTLPIVLPVEWAGDTPVITMTDQKVPMLGAFTARVLFYGDQYVGIWKGTDHGGTMWGTIEPAGQEPQEGGELTGDEGNDEGDDEEGGGGDDDGGPYVHWPSFRGPRACGVAEGFTTVMEWDVESGENVRWRVPIAGLAHSSPVIWGDRIYLTSAVKEGQPAELKVGLYGNIAPVQDDSEHEFRVLCIDKRTGEVLWDQLAWKGVPEIKRHPKGSHAAPSPATDGKHVVAFFGSEGLYCYTVDGELLWKKDFGTLDAGYYIVPGAQWGFCSSPVIHDGRVVVQVDVQGDSFVASLDVRSGEEQWRTARDEVPTWGTPSIDVREGRSQVVLNGWKHIGGYDLATGAELWKLVGGGDIPVPTPIIAQDLIFITNAHGRMAPIYAIDPMAEGEISMGHEAMGWSTRNQGNYMQTPLVYDDLLYLCSDAGILTCREAATGETLYRERLGSGTSGFSASVVAADGKLYVTSEEGEIFVVPASGFYEIIGQSHLGEECMATPAISEGVIYWRTRGHLVAVGKT